MRFKNLKILVCFLIIISMFLLNFNIISNFSKKNNCRKIPDILPLSRLRYCGNGICEYEIGETPLNCPQDCYLS